jgi:hypothetical protein
MVNVSETENYLIVDYDFENKNKENQDIKNN